MIDPESLNDEDIDKVMWNVMRVVVIVAMISLFLYLVSGCSTNIHDEAIQKAYFENQAKINSVEKASVKRPTISINCPNGCTFEYSDPNQKTRTTILNRPKTSAETGVELAKEWSSPVQNMVGIAAGVWGMVEIADTVSKNAGGNNTNTTVSGQNNSISSTESVVGDTATTSTVSDTTTSNSSTDSNTETITDTVNTDSYNTDTDTNDNHSVNDNNSNRDNTEVVP